jgi:hypothetical protein
MESLLDLHRKEIPQPEPWIFLDHFPGAFLQYFDDTPARDPTKALSTSRFRPAQADCKQEQGCGVYFSPNAFIGARRLSSLKRIQAVFLDIDCGKEGDGQARPEVARRKEGELLALLTSPLPPHAVIETKNGLQPIWKIRPVGIEDGLRLFREAIAVLLRRFGGDARATDPARVLRLPGYLHLKNLHDPFRCLLVWNSLDRETVSLQALIDALYLPPGLPDRPARQAGPVSHWYQAAPDVSEVIRAAAAEASISITFRLNRDGSRQIIEDGEVTSGFVSSRGNFCYSSSGKDRKGGPVQLVQYYLNLDRERAWQWLTERFGSPQIPAKRRGARVDATSGQPKKRPDCLAHGSDGGNYVNGSSSSDGTDSPRAL